MSKIIPLFYLPKEFPEYMKLLAEGLVANDGQTFKSAVLWLQGKLVSHEGRKVGSPKSDTTIKNYLAGFYVLDLFKADNNLYSESPPLKRASVPVQARIEVIKPLRQMLQSSSIDLFKESFIQVCSQYSQIVREYSYNRWMLQEKYQLKENPQPAQLQESLTKHCGYSYVGNPGVGYLDMFYRDKVKIDNYLKLLDFIVENYGDLAQKSLGLVPLGNILNHLKQVSDYPEDDFKKHLIKLKITHRIELRTTQTQLARNMGIDLVDIRGVKYGFIKILEPAVAI